MNKMTAATAVFCAVLLTSTGSLAADEWSSAEQREEWKAKLEEESVGTDTSRALFAPTGHLVGLSGYFPLADKKTATVQAWLETHRQMLGLGTEKFNFESAGPFIEALPTGEDKTEDTTVGYVYAFSVILSDLKVDNRTLQVFLDLRNGPVVRGLYNSYYPAVAGYYEPNSAYDAKAAWAAVATYLGSAPTQLSSTRIWSSLAWLLERVPKKKELLWILSGREADGTVRSYVVSTRTGSVLWAGEKSHQFSGGMPELHRAFGQNGNILWDSTNPTDGCQGLGPTCVDPAFTASLHSRTEIPLMIEFWANMSSQSGNPFDWPWTAPNKSPLKATQEFDAIGSRQTLTVVLSHTGNECGYPPPCSNYQGMWFGIGDEQVDLYGHEFGHSALKDLKTSAHLATTLPGALVEAMADYIGIVSEDLRLLNIDRNPQAPRTDFRIVAPSSGATIDWRYGTCVPVLPSSQRGVLGHGFYQGWKLLVPGTPGAGRDGLFRAWRLTILNAFYYTTDSFPVGLDMVAALLAMTPPSQFVYSTYPYPNNTIAAGLLASGCW